MRVRRQAGRAPDEPRLEGARRAADRPDRRGDRERDPRRDRRRRARAADLARGDAARAARGASSDERSRSGCSSVSGRQRRRRSTAGSPSTAAPRSCRCSATGSSSAETLVDVRGVVPRGVDGAPHRRRDDARRAGGATRTMPDALREACRLAASPQLRNMSSLGGNLLQSTRCWYWRLELPVPAARRRSLPRARGRAPRARDLRERLLRVCASVRRRRGAARARRAAAHEPARARRSPSCTGCPTRPTGGSTTLEPGELILEVELPPVEASVYLKAMDRKRWSFPQVGVAAARSGRRDADRARRRGARPVAPRRPRGARRGDAAAPNGLEGGRRPGPRTAGAVAKALAAARRKDRRP